MDFIDKLNLLAKRVESYSDKLKTEEATKTSCVLPFLDLLNYDHYNPNEVVPEYCADYGTKKGEKIDYAIFREGKPVIFIECKAFNTQLDTIHASQLHRYYSVSDDTRIGIVTNGRIYRFFADIDKPNQMDLKPFLEFDLFDFSERDVKEIKKFVKGEFDVDQVLSVASELKFVKAVTIYMSEQYENPDDDFVRLFSKEAYSGKRISSAKLAQFKPLVQAAFKQFVNNKVNNRLQTALTKEDKTILEEVPTGAEEEKLSDIETTETELIGFRIVMSICGELLESLDDLTAKDTKSYFGILFQNNSWKPIVRLHFNNEDNLAINLFEFNDGERLDRVVKLDTVQDIYKYKDDIRSNLKRYLE